jgi:uridine kinase
VNDVVGAIAARVGPGMRVAIDGVSAAGKTGFAGALAALVPDAVRVTIDDFHAPPPQEYADRRRRVPPTTPRCAISGT